MNQLRRLGGWMLKGLLVLYAAQVCLILVWQFRPMKSATRDGVRFEVFWGGGMIYGLIPLFGASPLIDGEPVRLVKTDLSTGERSQEAFDLFDDLVKKYPAVWPEASAKTF